MLLNILKGWGKTRGILKVHPAEKKLSELRMVQCKNCPFVGSSKILKILKGAANYEKVLYCTKCKCPAEEKTIVVNEKCPVGKW